MSGSSALRRLAQHLGLVYADDGQPRRGNRRPSRYGGPWISPRLDEDVDDLRARLDSLERRPGS